MTQRNKTSLLIFPVTLIDWNLHTLKCFVLRCCKYWTRYNYIADADRKLFLSAVDCKNENKKKKLDWGRWDERETETDAKRKLPLWRIAWFIHRTPDWGWERHFTVVWESKEQLFQSILHIIFREQVSVGFSIPCWRRDGIAIMLATKNLLRLSN